MKKILPIMLIFYIFSIPSYGQVTGILPLNSVDLPNGAYVKDLGVQLPYYEGKWVGVLNDKKYTFEFVKFSQHLSQYELGGDYYYMDDLMGKFKVEDLSTGTVLYDNLSAVNYDDYNIFLASLRIEASFGYLDTINCLNSAGFYLSKLPANPDQLRYNNFALNEYLAFNCPFATQAEIPMFLPTSDLILTKM